MTLTSPQATFLYKAMKGTAEAVGSASAVASRLRRRGQVEITAEGWTPTRVGLEALLDYWMRKDAASGCIAYQRRRQEVETALALVA